MLSQSMRTFVNAPRHKLSKLNQMQMEMEWMCAAPREHALIAKNAKCIFQLIQ